jgi:hypothetical protein
MARERPVTELRARVWAGARPLRGWSALLLVLALFAASACATTARMSGAIAVLDPEIDESSGLIVSGWSDEVFWTHNDSGDVARIFAIDLSGRILAEYSVEGAVNVDWEAITRDDRGNLLIGDIGNNRNNRSDLTVYAVREPDLRSPGRTIRPHSSVRFRYPEQRALPDPQAMNFDAEALFWWNGRLLLLTKHRSDENTALYLFPEEWGDEVVDLVKISETDVGSMVTDAAISPDGRHLAVLTYRGITIFAAPQEGWNFLANRVRTIRFATSVTQQCEGLAWVGDTLYMTNEQRALHRLHDPLNPSFVTYPRR